MIIISGFIVAFYKYRDHWIEITMVFSSAWYFLRTRRLWATCNFSVCESPPSPSPVPQGYLKLVSLLLSPRPKRIVSEGKKNETKTKTRPSPHTPAPPGEHCLPPLSWTLGQSSTAEKLQLVTFFCLNSPTMLSCLQVNLSWGICHGSSRFCI